MTEVTSNEDQARKLVVEHLGVEAEKVTADADFADDLGADSLDMIELVMAFEEEFGCEIPDDAAEQSALNRQGITENARRVKELEREVAELKALVAKLVDER